MMKRIKNYSKEEGIVLVLGTITTAFGYVVGFVYADEILNFGSKVIGKFKK